MATNRGVICGWLNSRVSSAGNLCTDGQKLFSYRLLIGFTSAEGEKVVLDYTAKTGEYYSQTTSCHVGMASVGADQIMHPKVYKTGICSAAE